MKFFTQYKLDSVQVKKLITILMIVAVGYIFIDYTTPKLTNLINNTANQYATNYMSLTQ